MNAALLVFSISCFILSVRLCLIWLRCHKLGEFVWNRWMLARLNLWADSHRICHLFVRCFNICYLQHVVLALTDAHAAAFTTAPAGMAVGSDRWIGKRENVKREPWQWRLWNKPKIISTNDLCKRLGVFNGPPGDGKLGMELHQSLVCRNMRGFFLWSLF